MLVGIGSIFLRGFCVPVRAMIRAMILAGVCSGTAAKRMQGRLGFVLTSVFGKVGSAQLTAVRVAP